MDLSIRAWCDKSGKVRNCFNPKLHPHRSASPSLTPESHMQATWCTAKPYTLSYNPDTNTKV